jgi:rhodanese-related sulfurtransferase
VFDAAPAFLEEAPPDISESASPGALRPDQAWALVRAGKAVLVDVRTIEERKFVGLPPRSIHVPWATGIEMKLNPNFAGDLEKKVKKTDTVLLLCRSGKRSGLAARVAADAGFARVFNILEGFEGDLDDESRRGNFEGWRFRGLPWVQE